MWVLNHVSDDVLEQMIAKGAFRQRFADIVGFMDYNYPSYNFVTHATPQAKERMQQIPEITQAMIASAARKSSRPSSEQYQDLPEWLMGEPAVRNAWLEGWRDYIKQESHLFDPNKTPPSSIKTNIDAIMARVPDLFHEPEMQEILYKSKRKPMQAPVKEEVSPQEQAQMGFDFASRNSWYKRAKRRRK